MNRTLLADMGIRFWKFRSQTPVTRDPERLTAMVEKLVRVGVLIPEEGRLLASDIFNREFRKIGADWVRRPITLTLAGIQSQSVDITEKSQEPSMTEEAHRIIKLRDQLESMEADVAQERFAEVRKQLSDTEPEPINVPAKEFSSWFKPDAEKR